MKFKATEQQVRQMAANAINASAPVGLGFLHFNPNDEVKAEEIVLHEGEVILDYYRGRMVKLYISPDGNGLWEINRGREPTHDYQSWAKRYPTNAALASSAGAIPQ